MMVVTRILIVHERLGMLEAQRLTKRLDDFNKYEYVIQALKRDLLSFLLLQETLSV